VLTAKPGGERALSKGLEVRQKNVIYAEIGIKFAERHQDGPRPNFYDVSMKILHFIDSHTGGEPTRLVTSGGPDLGDGTLAERLENLRTKHDDWRAGVVTEPRGSDVIVGALLCEPDDPACAAAVIFFNNVGYLGMCGHGTIGLIVSLAYLGKIQPGSHRMWTATGH